MEPILWVLLGIWLPILWLLAGLLLTGRLSYPMASTPEKWWGGMPTKGSVFAHGFFWPRAIRGCKKVTDAGSWGGHWCSWIDYPNGHYTYEQVISNGVLAKRGE